MKNINRQQGFAFLIPLIGAIGGVVSFVSALIMATLAAYAFRIAVFVLMVTVYLFTIGGLYFGIQTVLSAMKSASPSIPSEMSIAASWFVPSNIGVFINGILTIGLIEFAFKHKNKIISLASSSAS